MNVTRVIDGRVTQPGAPTRSLGEEAASELLEWVGVAS